LGTIFLGMFLSFSALLLIHIIFLGINIYLSITEGLESLLQERNFVETIYFSNYIYSWGSVFPVSRIRGINS